MDPSTRAIEELLAGIMGPVMPTRRRRRNSFMVYKSKNKSNNSRKQDMYFYTVEKQLHDSKLGYLSGVYRFNASKQEWNAIKVVRHAKKKAAIERARRLSEQLA